MSKAEMVRKLKKTYACEDGFQKLPFHWMWWPALGGLVVGIGGLIDPRALSVGYDNIDIMACSPTHRPSCARNGWANEPSGGLKVAYSNRGALPPFTRRRAGLAPPNERHHDSADEREDCDGALQLAIDPARVASAGIVAAEEVVVS